MFYFFLDSRNGVGIKMFTGNKDENDFTVIQCKAVLNGAFSDMGRGKNHGQEPSNFQGTDGVKPFYLGFGICELAELHSYVRVWKPVNEITDMFGASWMLHYWRFVTVSCCTSAVQNSSLFHGGEIYFLFFNKNTSYLP